MFKEDLGYILKVADLKARGFNIIENVDFEIVEDNVCQYNDIKEERQIGIHEGR